MNLAGVSMTEALISIHTYFSENFSSISNIFLFNLIYFDSNCYVTTLSHGFMTQVEFIFFRLAIKMIDHFLFYGCGRIFGDSTFSDQNYEKWLLPSYFDGTREKGSITIEIVMIYCFDSYFSVDALFVESLISNKLY